MRVTYRDRVADYLKANSGRWVDGLVRGRPFTKGDPRVVVLAKQGQVGVQGKVRRGTGGKWVKA